jgi:hypothetical protein
MNKIKLAQTSSGSIDSTTATIASISLATTLVVFDSRVQDLDLLYSALLPGSIGFTVKAKADGLATITQLLTTTGAKYLSIVAHGEPGAVHLGKTTLKIEHLQAQAHQLQGWDVEEISLYSCELAQGDLGRDFIYQLSELTGATVAAAATKTGNRAFGGSWDLTVATGAITAPELFDASILESYPAVLAVSFGATRYFAVGPYSDSVIVGDFNGDGNLDLATTTANDRSTAQISVLLGTGTGGFGAKTDFALGYSPNSITAGDFNNDGNLDLATVVGSIVSVVLGNGTGVTGGFGARTDFAVGSGPISVTAGDFNGDGKLDLATANFSSNNVSVLLGTGTGSFGGFVAKTDFAVGTNPESVIVGDFNGDGKLDLATANSGSNNISVLLGTGTGGFGAKTDFAVGTQPNSVTVGDFNDDGKLDLATANSGSSNVSVLLGTGTGGFGAKTDFAVGIYADSVTAGDFNGDGKLDLATANASTNNVSVRLNTSIPTLARNDFNGDGKSDILWRNDNGNIALWQMNGATITNSSLVATAVPTAWQVVGTGDFNGDRKAEILWRNTTDGNISIGQYNPITAPPIVGVIPTALQVASTGDFNGDGKSDILWRNTNGDVSIWQMNGTASNSQTVIANVTTDWKISGTGDFNGDGKADILWRNDDGSIALWQMNGSALLSPTSLTSTPSVDSSWKINGIADFNGDGKSDILWRNDNGQVAVWTMDGATALSKDLTNPNSSVDNSWKITGTSDFNSDGKADILWRNNDGSTAIWEMNGSMVTATSLTSIPLVDSTWKIAAPIL